MGPMHSFVQCAGTDSSTSPLLPGSECDRLCCELDFTCRSCLGCLHEGCCVHDGLLPCVFPQADRRGDLGLR